MLRFFAAGSFPRFAAFCLALCCVRPAVAWHADTVPDWVRTAASTQPAAPFSPETDAAVLLDDTTVSVAPNGSATEHHRRVVRILRPQGRDAATVFVPFDADSKVLSLHVWSIGPDGHPYAIKDNEIAEAGFPGQGNFYEDIQARIANPPGRDPGGLVAVEYDQRVRPYDTEQTWFFQGPIPVVTESFTLELPPGFTYGAVWAHHGASQVVELEHGRFRWEMHDVPAVELRHTPMHPAELALAGRMTVHYAAPGHTEAAEATWKGIGEWYGGLAHDRVAASPDLAAKARELVAGRSTFAARSEAIATWVQTEVRYFVIERGIGGQQPHFAADIFRNQYGDCKDKATLLAAMLSAVDIHATLVMVDDRRGVIDPDAPSTVGNHMIAAVEIPAGTAAPELHSVITAKSGRRYLIFDPTQERVPFGQLPHYLQGSYGVLVENAQSQIIELPVLDPSLNTLRRSANFSIAPDGTLTGTVTEKRFGDLAMRRRALYNGGDAKEQTEFLDRALGSDFGQFKVADVKVENASALDKDLITTYALEVGSFARTMGPLLMLRPRVLGHEGPEPDHKARHIAVDLGATEQITDDYAITLPSGYAVDEVPDPVKVDLGFASYESSSHVVNNTLHYTRTYTVRQLTLPAEKYADVQRLAGIIYADEQNQAVLKKM